MLETKLREAIDLFYERNWKSNPCEDYSDLSHVLILSSVIGKPLRSVKVYANVIDMRIEFTVEGTLYRQCECYDLDDLLETICCTSETGFLVVYGYSDDYFAKRTCGETLCSIDDWYVEVDLVNFEFPGLKVDEACEVINNFIADNFGREECHDEWYFHNNLSKLPLAEMFTDDDEFEGCFEVNLPDMRLEIVMDDAYREIRYPTVGALLNFISNSNLEEFKNMVHASDEEFEQNWHGETWR